MCLVTVSINPNRSDVLQPQRGHPPCNQSCLALRRWCGTNEHTFARDQQLNTRIVFLVLQHYRCIASTWARNPRNAVIPFDRTRHPPAVQRHSSPVSGRIPGAPKKDATPTTMLWCRWNCFTFARSSTIERLFERCFSRRRRAASRSVKNPSISSGGTPPRRPRFGSNISFRHAWHASGVGGVNCNQGSSLMSVVTSTPDRSKYS